MPNPAFIVEGQMEQRIVAKLCPGQPVRRINCNGDDVQISRMCDFIETQVRLLGNRYYPIIILFDRENRAMAASEISVEVVKTLEERGLGDQDIRVYVADRETEDWYLKDVRSICAHYGITYSGIRYEGKGGLARLLRPVLDYHETTTGVEIFTIVSKERIAEQCDIFAGLIRTAQEIECRVFNELDI